jgi:hypothetical protein
MSELINRHDNRATIRWKLLTGVSALALTVYVSSADIAKAEDTGQPQIWIELGGQLSRLDNGEEAFAPPLMADRASIFTPSQKLERPPLFSFEEEGKISFQPEDSDWVFSASVRYGHSASNRHVHQQSKPAPFSKYYHPSGDQSQSGKKVFQPLAARFAETNARTSEQHSILDFQVGKDVGLGLFGKGGSTSVVNLGVRFAQFASKANIALKSNPEWRFNYRYFATYAPSIPTSVVKAFYPTTTKIPRGGFYRGNAASLSASRSFHGLGPSVSWNASAPFAGKPQEGEISIDWGMNAALLFGRQRAKVHHQMTGRYHTADMGVANLPITYQPPPVNVTRSRTVIVPNVGGFAGLSFRYADAKLSFGYRADLFFHAMDGGIGTRRSENRGFYGPFASVSVGIGG